MTVVDARDAGGHFEVKTGSSPIQGRPDVVVLNALGMPHPLRPDEARALGVALFESAYEAERPGPDNEWP